MSKFSYKSLLCSSESVLADQLETDRRIVAFDRTIQHLNRRGFLGAMLSVAALATVDPHTAAAQTSAATTVLDVLNFALNLEYLEANFYLYVSTGAGLPSSANGSGVAVQGAPGKLSLDTETLALCQALAQDEVNHVNQLRTTISALNGTPVPQPAIDLSANGPITTQAQFLAAARQFTALGGSAYIGGAQQLVSNPAVLTAAAQILGAEGQHAGYINNLCVRQNIVSPAIDKQDVPPSMTNYFTVTSDHALGPSRSTAQVLGVVYKISDATTTTPATGTTMGGFFPQGVNGDIKST